MSEFVIVLTTSDSKKALKYMATVLIEQKLAACCQISSPIESFYKYENKFENTTEWLLIIKTHKKLFKEVESTIKSLHTYKTPEIVQIDIESASSDYREWMSKVLKI